MSKTFFKKQEELFREITALTSSFVAATRTRKPKSIIIQKALKLGYVTLNSPFQLCGEYSSKPHFVIAITSLGQKRVKALVEEILPHTPNDIFWKRNGKTLMGYLDIEHLVEYIIHANDDIRNLALVRYKELTEVESA